MKAGEHMDCQNETRNVEGLRDHHSLNIRTGNWIWISQRFFHICIVMICVYNFESTTCRLFCELEQYFLLSVCLESIRFLSYV